MLRCYEPGELVTGIHILGSLDPKEKDSSLHKYHAVWECCGKRLTMTHKNINDRKRHGRKYCRSCAQKHGTAKRNLEAVREVRPETPYGVRLPTWAPTTAGLNWRLR